eukprot:scaffold2925_cov51-Attheya_sp.AAC.2
MRHHTPNSLVLYLILVAVGMIRSWSVIGDRYGGADATVEPTRLPAVPVPYQRCLRYRFFGGYDDSL